MSDLVLLFLDDKHLIRDECRIASVPAGTVVLDVDLLLPDPVIALLVPNAAELAPEDGIRLHREATN